MSDPATQLQALWELGDEGTAEWWPKCIVPQLGEVWYYNSDGCGEIIDPQHALDLVTAEIERWLDKTASYGDWVKQMNGVLLLIDCGFDGCESTLFIGTLPEALAYAMRNSSIQ